MRTLYLAIFPVLLILFLVACGSSATSTPEPAATSVQPSATAAQASEGSDQVFKMQFVCINRSLQTCDLFTEYVARVNELSNGELELEITSLPELGISGTDMLVLLEDGTVEFTELPGNFVGGTWPFIEIAELYGLFPDTPTQNEIFAAVRDDEVRIIRDRFGGEVIFYDYYPDQFFYSKEAPQYTQRL